MSAPAKRPARILLSGYYGCGNLGDEAVLAGIAASFAERAPGRAELTVLSQDPADTRSRHGLPAVPRMSRTAVREALRNCDLLVSGGGSLLQDTTSMRSLVYYLGIVMMARMARKPVMFYAQGIGPLRRPAARAATRLVADRVQRITVRDEGSRSLLASIGVKRPPVEVTADPALALMPIGAEEAERLLRQAGASDGGTRIGVALREWPGAPDEAVYPQLLDRACARLGAQAVFLPMQPPGDLDISVRVAGGLAVCPAVVSQPLSPVQMLGVVGRMAGLVAMRLHTLIFAVNAGVPCAALAYDPKVEEFMRTVSQEGRSFPLKELEPDVVAAALCEAVERGEALRGDLRVRAGELRAKALLNVDRALELV